MKFKITLLILIIFSGLCTSCNQTQVSTTQAPTLEIINLQIIPELEHWMPRISQCANSLGGIGLYTEVKTQQSLDIQQTDLLLRLGQREEDDPVVAIMGYEEIVLILGEGVPLSSLSIESLQAIYSGELTNWKEVPEIQDQGLNINQVIHPMSLPEDNVLRNLFLRSFLNNQRIINSTIIYATPEGLNQRLQDNPYGIGYLLGSQLLSNQVPLNIVTSDPIIDEHYVLAVTNEEPTGKLKQLLLCLQISQ